MYCLKRRGMLSDDSNSFISTSSHIYILDRGP